MTNKYILETRLTKEEVIEKVKEAINFETEKMALTDYASNDIKELITKLIDNNDESVDEILDKSVKSSIETFKELGDVFIENVQIVFKEIESDSVAIFPFIAAIHKTSTNAINKAVEEFSNDKEVELVDICDNYLYASTVHKILETIIDINKESWKGVNDTQKELDLVNEIQSNMSECAIKLLKEAKNIHKLMLTSNIFDSIVKEVMNISSEDEDGKKRVKTHIDATSSKYKN